MAKFYILGLILLAFSACDCAGSVVKSSNGGGLTFSPIPEVNVSSTLTAKFDGKGLEPWYDLAKSFIHTVQKDDLPYDEIEKMKDGDKKFDVKEFLKGWELPFLAVFAIGFLFAIIVPIVGFCFCCCRCCGNCGGEMVQKESNKAALKRVIFAIALTIITLLMFTGCLMAFVSNDRITDTVESYKTTPVKAIRDTEQYFNRTVNVVNDHVIKTVLDVLVIVSNDVVKLPSTIANEVSDKLKSAVREPLVNVITLANRTKQMGELLEKINTTTTDLKLRFENLNKDIEDIRKDINNDTLVGSALNTGANFSALPDVTEQLNNIADVNRNNLAGNAERGLKEFDDISKTIQENTRNATKSIEDEIKNAKNEFETKIKDDIVDEVNKLILSKTDGWVKDIEDAFEDRVKPYDKYRYYAGVGLICLILIPVVLMALGLLCGIFGHDKNAGPTERGVISNIGGNSLMAAVGFMFIFVFFLMLFVAICFVFGAHLEKGCYAVREETLYRDFLDNPKYWKGDYLLGDAVFQNGSKKLTIEEILASCRKNDPIYKAIKGSRKWNLTEKFNVKDKLGDIDEKLNEFNVDIKKQKILTNETTKGLEDLENSGVDDIDFEQFFNETGKPVLNNNEIDELKKRLNTSNDPKNISARLEEIQNQTNSMNETAKQLRGNVDSLKILGQDIKTEANTTLDSAKKANDKYNAQANTEIGGSVRRLSGEILGYIDQTTVWAAGMIQNDLGRCKILADVYDAAVNLVCRDTVYPFNGFWFAIGMALFFYIPAIIFSVKLAKHYRRMRFEEGFDKHEGMEMHDRNKPWLNQGNAVYPK